MSDIHDRNPSVVSAPPITIVELMVAAAGGILVIAAGILDRMSIFFIRSVLFRKESGSEQAFSVNVPKGDEHANTSKITVLQQ